LKKSADPCNFGLIPRISGLFVHTQAANPAAPTLALLTRITFLTVGRSFPIPATVPFLISVSVFYMASIATGISGASTFLLGVPAS
jgi:hypothetical protein